LEPWIHDLLKGIKNPKLKILEASSALSLREGKQISHPPGEEHHRLDPHIWLDFQMDQVIIEKIALSLSDIESLIRSLGIL